jgi:ABC-type antimicrobial peptide transport system permease subunit
MALGADHDRILQMVLGQGAIQLLIGLVLGLGLSLVIGTVAGGAIAQSAVLFDISPRDPLTYAAVALLLTVVAFIATFVPARKATRVDPMIALRSE